MPELFSADFIAAISRMKLNAGPVPRGGRHAQHASAQLGPGMEFRDFRPYLPGDDIRRMDWNLYRRSGRLFLRLFEEERDLPVYILLDCSDSMFFEDPPRAHAAKQAAAVLIGAALNQHDLPVLYPFGETLNERFPSILHQRALPTLLERIAAMGSCGPTHLVRVLHRMQALRLRKGVVVVISDFFDPAGIDSVLQRLQGLPHKLLLFQVLRDGDAHPQLDGELSLEDCETGADLRVTVTPQAVAAYQRAYADFQDKLIAFAAKRGAGYITLDADRDVLEQFRSMFTGGVIQSGGSMLQFLSMSAWLFTGLAILIAGILAALQLLRIRPRRLQIVTILFWEQAAHQARARTLLERFRHPRTYLLLLAVSLLLLLALTEPAFHRPDQPHRVIVLEAGLGMTAADNRFETALDLVRAQATSLGAERIAVLAADPHPRLLKHFDESPAVLKDRLSGVAPAGIPVVREAALRVAKSLLNGRVNGEVVLVAAQPVKTDDLSVRLLPAGDVYENSFILSATFVPDPANLSRGTFSCRVGFTGKRAGTRTIKIIRPDGVLLEQTVVFKPGDMQDFAVSGISSDGSTLTAQVSGNDAVAGDNRIDFTLPDRRQILVVPNEGMELPAVLVSLITTLPGVTMETEEGANPAVVRVGQKDGGTQLVILPGGERGELQPVHAAGHPLLPGLIFEDALCRAPSIPWAATAARVPLLFVNGSPVAELDTAANRLTVAETLFDEEASLVRRTGYMVFWSTMLQYLAGWRSEPLTLSPAQANRTTDLASSPLVLNAGMDNFDLLPAANAVMSSARSGGRLPVWQVLLFAALVLMLVEAVLHIRGKIS